MSSTAIVSKLLAERNELATPHGRDVMGVLLFQDLAVVAFLIATPTLAEGGDDLWKSLAIAGGKAAVALAVILFFGQKPMRAWFTLIARLRSPELFMLNVLLVTLGLAAATETGGTVVRARRVSGRHAHRGNRVSLSGRGGHQAVSRRPARLVLRDGGHVSGSAHGRREHRLGLDVALSGRWCRRSCWWWCSPACSARRSARRCAPASTSARRASSRSSCWRWPPISASSSRRWRSSCSRRWCCRCSPRRSSSSSPSRWCAGSPPTTGWRAPRR